jgi:nitric oxide reductase activation protein
MDVQHGYELARELHARLWPEEEEESGEGASEAQQNGEGEGEENQEVTSDEGEKRSKDEDTDVPKNNDGKVRIDWSDLIGDDHHDKMPEGVKGDEEADYEINYAGWTTQDGGQYYPDSHIDSVPMYKNPPPLRDGDYHPDTSFANQMRRYIQSTNRASWETNRLTGRINKRALKRIRTGTSEFNRKVFQRRQDSRAINTCITLLVDWSGSMSGDRAKIASNAAATLVDCFEGVLGVPVEVLAHTVFSKLTMYHIKDYGARMTGHDVYNGLWNNEMCGNADGDALLYARDRIVKRPEKRKLIISIADGMPADSFDWGDPASLLTRAIESTRNEGIEVYGIGAQHENIGIFYGKDSVVINDLSDLSRTLLNVAQTFVLE